MQPRSIHSPELGPLLENFGRLAALCQRLELGCATKLVLAESIKAWGGEQDAGHRERLRKLRSKTMGQSVELLAKSLDLPEWKSTLQPAIAARNELHHNFFIHFDVDDPEIDVAAALMRLNEIEQIVRRAYELVFGALEPLLDAFEGDANPTD